MKHKQKSFFFSFRAVLIDCWELLFPRFCVHSGCKLLPTEQHICIICEHDIRQTFSHKHPQIFAKELFSDMPNVKYVVSFMWYKKNTPTQSVELALKFHGKKDIGILFGERYGYQLYEAGLFSDVDYIAPMPIHPKRMKKRGYNQSEMFAAGLSKGLNIPINTSVLIKTRNTTPQTQMTAATRKTNQQNAFAVQNTEQLSGKHIILVDDVITTGSTCRAAIAAFASVPDLTISIVSFAKTQEGDFVVMEDVTSVEQ